MWTVNYLHKHKLDCTLYSIVEKKDFNALHN